MTSSHIFYLYEIAEQTGLWERKLILFVWGWGQGRGLTADAQEKKTHWGASLRALLRRDC
jgi:hypothetical protein